MKSTLYNTWSKIIQIPEVLKSQKLSNFFEQFFIKCRKNFQILHQYLYSLRSVIPEHILII